MIFMICNDRNNPCSYNQQTPGREFSPTHVFYPHHLRKGESNMDQPTTQVKPAEPEPLEGDVYYPPPEVVRQPQVKGTDPYIGIDPRPRALLGSAPAVEWFKMG
jgi:hypothetical protein